MMKMFIRLFLFIAFFSILGVSQAAAQADESRTTALSLYYISMGLDDDGNAMENGRGGCISCPFVITFFGTLAKISESVYGFTEVFFTSLVPIFLSIWIAVQAVHLSLRGGEGGGQFASLIIKRCTLFFFLWFFMVGSAGNSGNQAWNMAGPGLLNMSFGVGYDTRAYSLQSLMNTPKGVAAATSYECGNIREVAKSGIGNAATGEAAGELATMACALERSMMFGFAVSVGMLQTAWFGDQGFSMLEAISSTIIGFIMLGAFAVVFAWILFLMIDVVVKVLVVAALLPFWALAAFFPESRKYTMGAINHGVSAFGLAIAVAVVSILGVFLISYVPEIYQKTHEILSPTVQRPLQPLVGESRIELFSDFLVKLQLPQSDGNRISMAPWMPWTIYLLLIPFGLLILGRKIVGIVEGILSVKGLSAMADSAAGLTMATGKVAGMATMAGGAMAYLTAKTVAPGAGQIAGIAAGQAVAGVGAMTGATGMMKAGRMFAGVHGDAFLRRYTPFGRQDLPSGGYSPVLQAADPYAEDLRAAAERQRSDQALANEIARGQRPGNGRA